MANRCPRAKADRPAVRSPFAIGSAADIIAPFVHLPAGSSESAAQAASSGRSCRGVRGCSRGLHDAFAQSYRCDADTADATEADAEKSHETAVEIGRASCRERG